MNKNIFIDEIPEKFIDKLPVSVFYTQGYSLNHGNKKVNMFFAPSDFYMTKKMHCFNLYKPSII